MLVCKFVITCDSVVMDMDDNFQVQNHSKETILAITGVMIDVPIGKISL